MKYLLDTNVVIAFMRGRHSGLLERFESVPREDKVLCTVVAGELSRQGQMIGPYDLQIAGIALANDLTLVTHNTREFARVPDLRLVDWEA